MVHLSSSLLQKFEITVECKIINSAQCYKVCCIVWQYYILYLKVWIRDMKGL